MLLTRNALFAALIAAICGATAFAADATPVNYHISDFVVQEQEDPSVTQSPSDIVPPADPMQVSPEQGDVEAPIVDATDCCVYECYSAPRMVPNMLGEGLALPITNITNQGSQFFYLPVVRPATNNSVFPRDRFSFEYRQYVDTQVYQSPNFGGPIYRDIEQYTVRWEKTFCCGKYSIDVIAPFIDGPQYDQSAGDGAPSEGLEFGDLTIGLKSLVYGDPCKAVSVGLQIEAPTGGDLRNDSIGIFNFRADRDVWHFTPYVAAAYTPNDCLFAQAFGSYRFASSDIQAADLGGGNQHTVNSVNALMLDASVGYWFHTSGCGRICRWAPMFELHYYSTSEDHQYISGFNPGGLSGNGFGHVDYLTLTVGATAELANNATISAGFAFPTRDNNEFIGPTIHDDATDNTYDWQFILQYNSYCW